MAKPRKKRRILFWLVNLPILAVAFFIIACNLWVVVSTDSRVYGSVETVPRNDCGLVLGTSRKVAPDRPNLHFEHRLQAAADLYHSRKVNYLLVSGDRDSAYYNEPRDMIRKLKELGVPPEKIKADDAGFRTLDSVVRAHTVFKLDRVTIISDDFHVGRALFIADRKKMHAVALASEPVDLRLSLKTRLREYLARVKAVLDIYILRTLPESQDAPPVEIYVNTKRPRAGSAPAGE